jgi:hypothetical protein
MNRGGSVSIDKVFPRPDRRSSYDLQVISTALGRLRLGNHQFSPTKYRYGERIERYLSFGSGVCRKKGVVRSLRLCMKREDLRIVFFFMIDYKSFLRTRCIPDSRGPPIVEVA